MKNIYSYSKFVFFVLFLLSTLNLKAQECTYVPTKVNEFKKCVEKLRGNYEEVNKKQNSKPSTGLTKNEMYKELKDYYAELIKHYRNMKDFDNEDIFKEKKKSLPKVNS